MDGSGNGNFYNNKGSIFKTTILTMKNIYVIVFGLLMVMSCDKKEQTTENSVKTEKSTEVSQVQEPMKIKNDKGEEIAVTYFAEGDEVAVKILRTGEEEQKLTGKTTSPNGNPIFSNDKYMWEMTQEGKGGKLTSKSGETSEYK